MPIPTTPSTPLASPFALAIMAAYCHWDPTAIVDNEEVVLDGNGTPLLTLPSLYVTDVSAVSVVGCDDSAYVATVGTDVMWNANGQLRWVAGFSGIGCWPDGLSNVTVTYSGGYTDAPADLVAVLASIDGRMPKIQSGLQSAKIGTAAMGYAANVAAGDLLLVESMVLDKYRIVQVA